MIGNEYSKKEKSDAKSHWAVPKVNKRRRSCSQLVYPGVVRGQVGQQMETIRNSRSKISPVNLSVVQCKGPHLDELDPNIIAWLRRNPALLKKVNAYTNIASNNADYINQLTLLYDISELNLKSPEDEKPLSNETSFLTRLNNEIEHVRSQIQSTLPSNAQPKIPPNFKSKKIRPIIKMEANHANKKSRTSSQGALYNHNYQGRRSLPNLSIKFSDYRGSLYNGSNNSDCLADDDQEPLVYPIRQFPKTKTKSSLDLTYSGNAYISNNMKFTLISDKKKALYGLLNSLNSLSFKLKTASDVKSQYDIISSCFNLLNDYRNKIYLDFNTHDCVTPCLLTASDGDSLSNSFPSTNLSFFLNGSKEEISKQCKKFEGAIYSNKLFNTQYTDEQSLFLNLAGDLYNVLSVLKTFMHIYVLMQKKDPIPGDK